VLDETQKGRSQSKFLEAIRDQYVSDVMQAGQPGATLSF
jgi:hypothetical protein